MPYPTYSFLPITYPSNTPHNLTYPPFLSSFDKGMTATALGMEPRTGWAVFAFGVATIVGFSGTPTPTLFYATLRYAILC